MHIKPLISKIILSLLRRLGTDTGRTVVQVCVILNGFWQTQTNLFSYAQYK